jgi:hypothetical protein
MREKFILSGLSALFVMGHAWILRYGATPEIVAFLFVLPIFYFDYLAPKSKTVTFSPEPPQEFQQEADCAREELEELEENLKQIRYIHKFNSDPDVTTSTDTKPADTDGERYRERSSPVVSL